MPTSSLQTYVSELLSGNKRALARVLSIIEDSGPELDECLSLLYPHTGKAYVLGLTGAPGVGKSTLVDALGAALVDRGHRVASLAVDPSSPYTGGALLGDRIRMSTLASKPGAFIRSMASRGALGGIAPMTAEAVFALDAAGYDYILVETVGVGQAEVEIVKHADTVVLVLIPGMGDDVQALKAGIIEIADVFAINKADYEGTHRLVKELVGALSLAEKSQRRPKIVKTIAHKAQGIGELLEAIVEHRQWAADTGKTKERRNQFLFNSYRHRLSQTLVARVDDFLDAAGREEEIRRRLFERRIDPGSLAAEVVGEFLRSRPKPANN